MDATEGLSTIEVEEVGDVIVIRFTSERLIEDLWINQMRNELRTLYEAKSPTKVVVDFAGVNFVSSAALGILMKLRKQVEGEERKAHGDLKLCNMILGIFQLFSHTRLDRLFEIQATREDALATYHNTEDTTVNSGARYATIDVKVVGHVTVATLVDKKVLNDTLIENIARELFYLADRETVLSLVVSFKPVTFLSSSILGKLITLNKRMKNKGGWLRLSDMKDPEIYGLFTLTNLTKVFDIRETEAEAIAAFN